MTTQLSTTDYTAIANCILANTPDECKSFELEYETPYYTMFLDVRYTFDTREVIGGSYECWDFERLCEAYNECFELVSYDVYNSDGDPIETDFSEGILLNLLNN